MSNLPETSNWDTGVYEIQTTDSVVGYNGSTIGIANQPGQNLVNRSLWLRERIAAAITQAGLAEGTSDNQQLAEAVVLQCASVVALRAVPIPVVPNSQTVLMHTRGQAADGDGLAQIYKWVYNAMGVDNGVTIIVPTGAGGSGRWIACGINANALGGTAAANFLTVTAAAAEYETIADATAKLATAEAFATTAANAALAAAETYAGTNIEAALTEAENYAGGVANTAQANAESYALTVATEAQNAAVASAESFATSAANTAQSNAETYANGTAFGGGHKFPGGYITQGGTATCIASAPGTFVTFPEPFTAVCDYVNVSAYGGNANVTVLSKSLTGFYGINGIGGELTWSAGGH